MSASSSATPNSASGSERGPRPINEDAVLSVALPRGRWLAAVADGMGGLDAGEAASRTALDTLREEVEAGRSLVRAVEAANRAVFGRSRERPMGTTLVAALLRGRSVRIANVGDSRAYVLGPSGLVQVTRDHTYGAEAAAQGGAAAREVAASRWGTTLSRSLGAAERVEVDEFGPLDLDGGVRLLLCSDGVHGVLPPGDIRASLDAERTVEGAVRQLLDRALERGGDDNLSAVVLEPAAQESTSSAAPGIVPQGGGVSEAGETVAPEATVKAEAGGTAKAGERVTAGGGPGAERTVAGGDASWDPGRLMRRASHPLRRKPGAFRMLLLLLVLVGALTAVLWWAA